MDQLCKKQLEFHLGVGLMGALLWNSFGNCLSGVWPSTLFSLNQGVSAFHGFVLSIWIEKQGKKCYSGGFWWWMAAVYTLWIRLGHVSIHSFQDLHGNTGTVIHQAVMWGAGREKIFVKTSRLQLFGKKFKRKQKQTNKTQQKQSSKQKQQQRKQRNKQKPPKKPIRRKEFSQWRYKQTIQADKEKSLWITFKWCIKEKILKATQPVFILSSST